MYAMAGKSLKIIFLQFTSLVVEKSAKQIKSKNFFDAKIQTVSSSIASEVYR